MIDNSLDAEVDAEELAEGVQRAANHFIRRGYLPSAIVLLASPRTIREQKLLLKVGHILEVKEAGINTGDVLICPLDEAQQYLRAKPPTQG